MQNKISHDVGIDQREKQQLLEELQLAKGGGVQSVRAVAGTSAAVTIRPADSVDRGRVVATGKARELRPRSVIAQVDSPVAVGSFYELHLDDPAIDAPVAFGRCDQITMLAEDRFEARFQFLQPITLAEEPVGRPE